MMKMTDSSREQLIFLKKHRRHRLFIHSCRLLLFAFFLGLWEIAARLGVLNDFIFSSPVRMGQCFLSLSADGSIFLHTGITVLETLISFLFVSFLSLIFALILWLSNTLYEILDPLLVMLNSLPKSALAPVLIVWLGNRPRTIIVTGILLAVFASTITLTTGFQKTDPEKIRLIQTLGASRKDTMFKLIIPASIPLLLSAMKVNIGLCLVGVIIGEFLAAKAGLGYLIIYSSQVFQMDTVMLSILILCIIAVMMYQSLAFFSRKWE